MRDTVVDAAAGWLPFTCKEIGSGLLWPPVRVNIGLQKRAEYFLPNRFSMCFCPMPPGLWPRPEGGSLLFLD